jgi:hypothetical protein
LDKKHSKNSLWLIVFSAIAVVMATIVGMTAMPTELKLNNILEKY